MDTHPTHDALIVVDMQRDFIEGSLAVPDARGLAEKIVKHTETRWLDDPYALVVASMDWHPEQHCSFTTEGGQWPPHCVRGTAGVRLSPHIEKIANVVVTKGGERDYDQYSAFAPGWLATYLDSCDIDRIFVCGIATDFCVKATVLEARKNAIETFVLVELCRGVTQLGSIEAYHDMQKKGAKLI